MKLIKKKQAAGHMEGPELCREYVITPKITFGSSTIEPGETGDIDWGHPVSHEVFYGVQGTVILRNPNNGDAFRIEEGDALLVEEGEPHELTNVGEITSVTTWSCGPTP